MDKGLSWDYAEFWRQKESRNKHLQPAGLGCWWAVGGKSSGYWVEIARSRPEREAEARHGTKFGRHWAGSRPRPSGRSYTTCQSPYDPEPGYVGIWKGRTAPPPRIGAAAPKRWPTEAPGLRPHGLRPYEYKCAQVLASRLITDRLRLSDDRWAYQRLRDHKMHILERRRHSGSLFQDKEEPTAAQFARGVRWAELESIELHRRHDQLRRFIDAKVDDHKLDFSDRAFKHHSVDGETGIISGNSGAVVGEGIDSNIADQAGFEFEEVDNTVARRRKRPPRERRKPGRKPIGLIAQTPAERARKYRRNKALSKTLATHERAPAGADQPLPLGLTVPANLSTASEMETITHELAGSDAGSLRRHQRASRRDCG